MKLILQSSTIEAAGVGVFSLTNIPAEQRIKLDNKLSYIEQKDEHEIADEFLKYCPLLSNGKFLCPRNFHHMNILWYINHSNTPNVRWTDNGFFSNREIQPGEELTVFYPDLETHPKNILWSKKYIEELKK